MGSNVYLESFTSEPLRGSTVYLESLLGCTRDLIGVIYG